MQCNAMQCNTIRVYCENTLSYNNGVLSLTGPKSGYVKAGQLIYRYSTNTSMSSTPTPNNNMAMGTNMAIGNQQKHLSLRFAAKA